MTHVNDLAEENARYWSEERAYDRAGAWFYDDDDTVHDTTPYCSVCQRGTKDYICGPCKREAS